MIWRESKDKNLTPGEQEKTPELRRQSFCSDSLAAGLQNTEENRSENAQGCGHFEVRRAYAKANKKRSR
jgi:hypothetical protein